MSWATVGRLWTRQIMSPRLMSRSSARRIVTDIGGNASSTGPSAVSIAAIVDVNPDGSTMTSSPALNMPLGDLARVPAVVVVLVVARPDHVLHREPAVDEVAVGADVHLLEVVQQRRALVPRHVVGALDDVVALQRRDRDEREVVDVELRRELAELVLDLLEPPSS